MTAPAAYPAEPSARDRFILARRPQRTVRDPWRHQGVLVEHEAEAGGRTVVSATVFLTGRECPWRCVMCDLWQYTIEHDTPPGAIAAQVRDAVKELRERHGAQDHPAQLKLYNAGSFFDPRAVPEADYEAIADAVRTYDRVVVESHPALVNHRLARFVAACRGASGHGGPAIEVAMGLETAHPDALTRLNKRTSLAQFAAAATAVHAAGATLRAFVLVGVPFIAPRDQQAWVQRSIAVARECGARVVSLIPLRRGNGAVEALERTGDIVVPRLADLEAALETALATTTDGRAAAPLVCADTWNLQAFMDCDACHAARVDRLHAMNVAQQVPPRVPCAVCNSRSVA